MKHELTVTPEDTGTRLDLFLSANIEGQTRSGIQKLIECGAVTLGGKAVSKNYRISAGERFSIEIPEPEPDAAEAQDIPLDIVFEDSDLIVINKPRGMVVHPAAGHPDGTLVNALLNHCGDSLSGINGVRRPGIVHRIDRDTSGLLVAAKNDEAHRGLAAQLADHSMYRVYNAILIGTPEPWEGTVNAPIGRHPKDRKKMAVTDRGSKSAVTHYHVLESFPGYSFTECRLETGRTHQIRVHMNYIGHPVAGDPVYGVRRDPFASGGQCLHAKSLSFEHPGTGELMVFESELPEYFIKVLTILREKAIM